MKTSLSVLALLAALACQNALAAPPKTVQQLRIDLDGDGREDLVRVRERGVKPGKMSYDIEIFYTGGKAAETYGHLVPQEMSADSLYPSDEDHLVTLQKTGERSFKIKDDFDGDPHMGGIDEIVVDAEDGILRVRSADYYIGHHGGDQADEYKEKYDFVNGTAFVSSVDALQDDQGHDTEPYHEKTRKLSPGCRPELREWKPLDVPACAKIKL